MTLAKQHISSASLDGPYWNDINFSPLLAIPDVSALCAPLHDVHSTSGCKISSIPRA